MGISRISKIPRSQESPKSQKSQRSHRSPKSQKSSISFKPIQKPSKPFKSLHTNLQNPPYLFKYLQNHQSFFTQTLKICKISSNTFNTLQVVLHKPSKSFKSLQILSKPFKTLHTKLQNHQ